MSPATPVSIEKFALPPSPPEPELFAPRIELVPRPRFAAEPVSKTTPPPLPPKLRDDAPPLAAPPDKLIDPKAATGPESVLARSFSKKSPPSPPVAAPSDEDALPPV